MSDAELNSDAAPAVFIIGHEAPAIAAAAVSAEAEAEAEFEIEIW